MPKEGHPTLLYVKLNIFLVSYSFSFLMLLKPNCPYRHAKEVIDVVAVVIVFIKAERSNPPFLLTVVVCRRGRGTKFSIKKLDMKKLTLNEEEPNSQ
jgi:hypothetical protein